MGDISSKKDYRDISLAARDRAAAESGRVVVIPHGGLLFIDLDDDNHRGRLEHRLDLLGALGIYTDRLGVWSSPTPGHYHACVRLRGATPDDGTRIGLQTALGGDSLAALFQYARLLAGIQPPCSMFESEQKAIELQSWGATVHYPAAEAQS